MNPDISEFSYGFALTRELLALADPPLQIAPVFPSLIQEGKKGGGYDVNLAIPGFPLYLQFKRSDCQTRSSAREAALFPRPYYRMHITERRRSSQHKMLLELYASPNEVFYAAPTFHTVEEINDAYRKNLVSTRSCYVRPAKIGQLDGESHYVAFNSQTFMICSEPRLIEGIQGSHLPQLLEDRLNSEHTAFGNEPLTNALDFVTEILRSRRLSFLDADGGFFSGIDHRLQRLAEIALQVFGAQLFVVQRREV